MPIIIHISKYIVVLIKIIQNGFYWLLWAFNIYSLTIKHNL